MLLNNPRRVLYKGKWFSSSRDCWMKVINNFLVCHFKVKAITVQFHVGIYCHFTFLIPTILSRPYIVIYTCAQNHKRDFTTLLLFKIFNVSKAFKRKYCALCKEHIYCINWLLRRLGCYMVLFITVIYFVHIIKWDQHVR